MLNIKKMLTKMAEALAKVTTASGSKSYNTNNGTVTVSYKRIGTHVISKWAITPSAVWDTGSSNRITCTIDSTIPASDMTGTGVELNGVFAHLINKTFRAQNNTGSALSANSNYEVTIVYTCS